MAYFEEMESILYGEFKNSLLSYEKKPYKKAKMYVDEDFAIILDDQDWQPIGDYNNKTLTSKLFGFRYFDSQKQRLEDFNCYMIAIVLCKIFLRLRNDPEFSGYWAKEVKFELDVPVFSHTPIYKIELPNVSIRKKIVKELASDAENQELLTDLWIDQLNGKGLQLLKDLQIPVPSKAIADLATLTKAIEKAKKLYNKDKYKEVISLLLPIAQPLVELGTTRVRNRAEYSCQIIGLSYDALNDTESAELWLNEGVKLTQGGHAAMSLCSFLQDKQQFEKLANTGEYLLFYSSKVTTYDNVAYACAYGLYGALAIGNEELAKRITHYAIQYFGFRSSRSGAFKNITEVLDGFDKYDNLVAKEMINWINNSTIQQRDIVAGNISELQTWWSGLSKTIQKHLCEEADIEWDKDSISDLSLSKIGQIEELDLEDLKLEGLAFLHPLVHLKELDISGNKIKDLSPLSALIKLKTLYADRNPEIDLRSIPALPELSILRCHKSSLKSLEGVEKLGKLKELLIYRNKITDLRPLLSCKNLNTLDINSNPINPELGLFELLKRDHVQTIEYESEEIEGAVLDKLPQVVNLQINGIIRYPAAIETCEKELTQLWTTIKETDPIWASAIYNLCWCHLEEKHDPDLLDLALLFYSRKELEFPNNIVLGSLDLLKHLHKNVRKLTLRDAGVTDLSPINDWHDLEWLVVSYNKLGSLKAVSNCQKMVFIEAHGCKLINLEGLENMSHLKWLSLFSNQIPSLESLKNCDVLETLKLSQNPISDLSPLKSLKNLKKLEISLTGNPLNLIPLAECTALEYIECIGNPDITSLEALIGLPNLHTVITAGTVEGLELFAQKRPDVSVC